MKKILWVLFSVGLIMFIVFATLSLVVGLKEGNNSDRKTVLNETYEDNIKNIKVNGGDAAVTIKKGDKFKVKSVAADGQFDVTSKVSGDTLNVDAENQDVMVNFNIFKDMNNEIEVTIPKNIESINVKNDRGKLIVKDINSKNSKFRVDTGMINISDSYLGNFEAYSDTGEILTNKTHFNNGKIQCDTGEVSLNDAPADTPLNIETDTGEVRLVYSEEITNTLLDIEQDVGDAQINRKELKNKKVGSGDNLVKIRSDVGSVQID